MRFDLSFSIGYYGHEVVTSGAKNGPKWKSNTVNRQRNKLGGSRYKEFGRLDGLNVNSCQNYHRISRGDGIVVADYLSAAWPLSSKRAVRRGGSVPRRSAIRQAGATNVGATVLAIKIARLATARRELTEYDKLVEINLGFFN